jgi:hypothetical protein
LKHVGAKNTKTKVQIVISCAFNNKKLVRFVGIIIVERKNVKSGKKEKAIRKEEK